MLCEQAQKQGVNLEFDTDPGKATVQYLYDTPEAAQLKYLLNFTLSGDERDKLVDSSFQSFFPKQEASMSRKIYMSFEQIHELATNGAIGTHAHEHLPLGLLSNASILDNIRLSLARLESWTGQKPFALSYPYGSKEACSAETGRMAETLGIHFAFTMERAANPDLTRPLFLARFDNNDLPGGKASKWTAEDLFQEVPHATWYS
jgi:peptidoglycan/xylan/chitin deacetylase (PgdA/CDA1 family)